MRRLRRFERKGRQRIKKPSPGSWRRRKKQRRALIRRSRETLKGKTRKAQKMNQRPTTRRPRRTSSRKQTRSK
ncbi:DEAD-box helicase 27 [Phyllostomus discolor]|uniref:DEAD-box helicase 27 n=1 Tax=Phyllostomus discolor TaxID=89673 RepID=A0A833ZA00_9CHIR|nr:DEAD-box helicase 27 [Phyllostomus discolor]